MTSSILVTAVVPAAGRKHFLSLTTAATLLLSPALPAHEEECFKFLSHLAAVWYPRARNECEGVCQSLSVNTITEKKRTGKKKKGFFFFLFDGTFFFAPSESRLRVMHARSYWECVFHLSLVVGVCFIFLGAGDVSCLSQQLKGVARRKSRGGKKNEKKRKERVG